MDLEAFYRAYYHIVYGYALSLCGDRAMAEDLASETFCRALDRIGHFDGGCRVTTWLCQITKHLYFNELRRRKRHTALEDWNAAAPPMEEACLERATARELFRAAEALPEPSAQVFRMRLEGLNFRDIGAALGRSENWARVTFYRAKNRILSEWEGKP